MNKIYTYGTLMPNDGRERVLVPGLLYNLGWYPGIRLLSSLSIEDCNCGAVWNGVQCEIIEVSDKRLKELDRYEGYDPEFPETSLYIRRQYLDGFIYEYNRDVNSRQIIESGDWQGHKKEREAACI